MVRKILIISTLLAAPLFWGGTAGAQQPNDNEDKVTICHRGNAVKNPYQRNSVDKSAVNGGGENDHSQHTGPVPTSEAQAQQYKDDKTDWGDIIPPFDGYAGLNWTAEGQAIYNNNCEYVDGGQGGNPVTPTENGGQGGAGAAETPARTQQVQTPAGAVNAGAGSTELSVTSASALVGSLLLAAYGLRRYTRSTDV